MTTDEQIEQLRQEHDKLQEGLLSNEMAIREGIIINVGEGEYDSYPRFGFQHFCWRNPACVRELDMFIKYANNRTVLADIGAYNGIFSLVFGKLNYVSRQYAFEPFPEAFETLFKIKSINNDLQLQTVLAGLSDKVCNVPMKNEHGHFIICPDSENEFYTACLSGDAYFSAYSLIPNFPDTIKIDVEGMELQVLKGFKKIIEKNHPIIFLELHLTKLSKEEVTELYNLVKGWDYKILNTENELEISLDEILLKEGELRLILI